jgi:Tfp pilus assembly protein PilF
VLQRQTSNYEHLVENTADRLKELVGPRDALKFLIAQMDDYPPWLDMAWDNAWHRNAYRLAEWRQDVGDDLGDLDEPLLRIVLAALRRDLRSRNADARYLFHDDYGYFWEAKRDVFAATAREVLAERRQSGRSVKHLAEYQYHGLDLRGAAIEALFVAEREGRLDESGQQQLVRYLHETERYGESIALLEGLVERRPDMIDYRTQLMTAYFKTDRPGELQALREATDGHFRTGGRWNETVMAALADACRATQLSELAVGYYDEAIALVQRQQPGRGVGGEALPRYYSGLAEAWAALGDTEKAVDAACGAVVSWGPRIDQRQAALDALRRVLAGADDLEQFAEAWDRKAQEAGEDSPLVRKMLGEVYLQKSQPAQAEPHLRAAIELEPTDLGVHKSLVECLDAQQKKDAAVEALLATIDVDRRNVELVNQLADRLAANESEAERAATMLVEASPQEAENHAALAERRQRQNRWDEAIDQWRHVARLRTKEPDGLVKLATAQVHEKRLAEAAETIDKLEKSAWPARFTGLPEQIRQLQRQIDAARQ